MGYFEETDLPAPDESCCGQGTRCLTFDLIAKANRPPAVGVVDSSHLARYDDTDLFQWHGRVRSGYWKSFGKVLRITDEGVSALRSELQSKPNSDAVRKLVSELEAVRK